MPKKVWLAGAKGAGKSKLLKALKSDGHTVFPNNTTIGDWAVDRLADYRTELDLAVERTAYPSLAGIFEDSLLDSVAYAATRLAYVVNDGIGTDDDLARWEITVHATARMLRDSEPPDAVIYVPGHTEEDFYERLEEAINAAIFELLPDSVQKFKLSSIEDLQRVEETAKILEELDGQNDATAESNGED